MSIKSIGKGLKTVLSISKLKVYALHELPDKISPPAAVILLGETIYHQAYGSSPYEADLILRLVILLGKIDSPSAASRIHEYIEASGALSIVAMVEADPTLNSSCDAAVVTRNFGLGVTSWGDVPYLSTEFEISVYT